MRKFSEKLIDFLFLAFLLFEKKYDFNMVKERNMVLLGLGFSVILCMHEIVQYRVATYP